MQRLILMGIIYTSIIVPVWFSRDTKAPRGLKRMVITMFLDRRHEVLSTTLLLARCIGTVSTPVCQYC